MNFKQMLGLVLLSIGVVLSVFALHSMGWIPEKHKGPKVVTASPLSPTDHLPENPPIHEEHNGKNSPLFLACGFAMVAAGIAVAARYKRVDE